MTENPILAQLVRLGLVDPTSLEVVGACRDRPDIEAVRCGRSGVIVLRQTAHATLSYYAAKDLASDEVDLGDVTVRPPVLDDARRRAKAFGHLVQGRDWLDLGAGDGGVLEAAGPLAASATGVEPNDRMRAEAQARGFAVKPSIDALGERRFDVVTLFHVFEHLPDPIGDLARIRSLLRPGGRLVIEVPHARDALIALYDCLPFLRFTLWSEHLILHTRTTLTRMIAEAGFCDITVKGLQRYNVANHLYWLRHGKPGGHAIWAMLDDGALEQSYANTLQSLDMTDTLLAVAHV